MPRIQRVFFCTIHYVSVDFRERSLKFKSELPRESHTMKCFLILICFLLPVLFKAQTNINSMTELAKADPEQVLTIELEHVKIFPKEIFACKNLKHLSISTSELKVIPNEIFQLRNLESLSFTHCPHITCIPDSIGLLTNLKTISFLMTHVTKLPESIGRLSELEFINLGYCRVKEFPASFYQLKKLKSLTIGFREQEPRLFTDAELEELKKKLPHCKIYYHIYTNTHQN